MDNELSQGFFFLQNRPTLVFPPQYNFPRQGFGIPTFHATSENTLFRVAKIKWQPGSGVGGAESLAHHVHF